MAKIKIMFLVAFVLVFAAGAVVGMVRNRALTSGIGDPAPRQPTSLSRHQSTPDLLSLNADQRKQWTEIWSKAMSHSHDPSGGDHHQAQKDRDNAIRSLLNEDQVSQYDEIMQKYHAQLDQMSEEHKKSYDDAVAASKAILTPDQATQYEAILKERSSHGGHGGPGPSRYSSKSGGSSRSGRDRASTKSSQAPDKTLSSPDKTPCPEK